jgi:hypothetical protein
MENINFTFFKNIQEGGYFNTETNKIKTKKYKIINNKKK